MVAPATSHQPSLISSQLLTERSQVLAFPVFFKTEFHPRFVQRALISRSWLRHMMVYTEETEVKEACETTSITIASLKLESGEDAGHKKLGCHFHRNPSRWIHQGSLGSIFGCAGGSAETLEGFVFHS